MYENECVMSSASFYNIIIEVPGREWGKSWETCVS